MTSELVRRVMNNIASKNIDTIPRKRSADIKDSYEYQKKVSLSNYNSNKDSNYNLNKKTEKKPINLNSLADEIRGTVKSEGAEVTSSQKITKTNKNNRITLSQLSKLSGAKAEESATCKPSGNSGTTKNKGLSLGDLAETIKKNN